MYGFCEGCEDGGVVALAGADFQHAGAQRVDQDLMMEKPLEVRWSPDARVSWGREAKIVKGYGWGSVGGLNGNLPALRKLNDCKISNIISFKCNFFYAHALFMSPCLCL